jgi:hypothetical protein
LHISLSTPPPPFFPSLPILHFTPHPDQTLQILMDLTRSARSQKFGIVHPGFSLSKHIRDGLQRHLPDNVHQLVSGKMVISLTRVSDGKNVLVSDFHSKDEVVDVSGLSGYCRVGRAISFWKQHREGLL